MLCILRACVSRQLLMHNHKMELTKFKIRVLLKHYWKQDYKAFFRRPELWVIENIRRVLEENPQESTRRLSEELSASKNTTNRQIKTLGKSYRSCGSLPHELTPLQTQRRVDIRRQLIGNLIDGRFIRRIALCNENGSITATLTLRNSDSVSVNLPTPTLKNRFAPKIMCV